MVMLENIRDFYFITLNIALNRVSVRVYSVKGSSILILNGLFKLFQFQY